MGTCLSHTLYIFTTLVYLMANLMPLNLTLFLTVHFHTVHGYAAIHMCITHVYASFTFCHCHAVASCFPVLICLSQTVLIDSVQTCTHIRIVYKSQGINWIPSLILLKFHL